MSKVDAQRAMREAKYARDSASGPTRRQAAAADATAVAPAVSTPAPGPAAARTGKASTTTPADVAPQGELCGHKSMNGRACTREAGHPEKNHRYG